MVNDVPLYLDSWNGDETLIMVVVYIVVSNFGLDLFFSRYFVFAFSRSCHGIQTGDGKLDMDDVKVWWKKVRSILTYQLPDATGFSMGFLLGVKYG